MSSLFHDSAIQSYYAQTNGHSRDWGNSHLNPRSYTESVEMERAGYRLIPVYTPPPQVVFIGESHTVVLPVYAVYQTGQNIPYSR